jgi:hypothetical protein
MVVEMRLIGPCVRVVHVDLAGPIIELVMDHLSITPNQGKTFKVIELVVLTWKRKKKLVGDQLSAHESI